MYELHPIARAFHALQQPLLNAAFQAGQPDPRIPTTEEPAGLSTAADVLARISTAAQTAAATLGPTVEALEAEAVAAEAALKAAEAAVNEARKSAAAARSAAERARHTVAIAPMVERLLADPPALRELLRATSGDFRPGPERDRLVSLGMAKHYENVNAIGRSPAGWSVLCILRQCVGPA